MSYFQDRYMGRYALPFLPCLKRPKSSAKKNDNDQCFAGIATNKGETRNFSLIYPCARHFQLSMNHERNAVLINEEKIFSYSVFFYFFTDAGTKSDRETKKKNINIHIKEYFFSLPQKNCESFLL